MKPNIVFLLLDTARAGNLSCYGYHRNTTPFLDELAASGVRYDRAFANSIYSLPSYGSLFTGTYPSEHGAIDWGRRVSNNELVTGFNDAGYETHAVSTHLVSNQFGIGEAFDEVEWIPSGARDYLFENDRVAERMAEKAVKDGWGSEREKYRYFLKTFLKNPSYRSVLNGGYQLWQKIKKDHGWWDDNGADAALTRARRFVRSAADPFFLFVNFVETHDPYRPPRGYIRRFMPDDVSFDEIREALDYSSVRATLGLDQITEREREILVALYDAELVYIDDKIAEFYGFLERQGVADETVVVVVSDHGDSFGEHGLWGHQGQIYTQVCHVPLVIHYPWETSRVETGVTELRQLCGHLLDLVDGEEHRLVPNGEALVEYYGLDTQLSFVPWEEYDDVDEALWSSYQVSLIDEDYALLWDATGSAELYDMSTDFEQTTDVSRRYPEAVTEYKSRIEQLVGEPAANHHQYRSASSDEGSPAEGCEGQHVRDRLRELGYLE